MDGSKFETDEDFRRIARTYGAEASQALLLAVRVARHAATVEDLQSVLASRTDIDLAVGIIMGQNRCTQQEAFETLRRASNSRNLKVRVLAAEMVARLNGEPATSTSRRGRNTLLNRGRRGSAGCESSTCQRTRCS